MRSRKLVVVGLGYVGLPVAVLAQEKGWEVVGYDTDAAKVADINRGVSPVPEVVTAAELRRYPLTATTDPSVVESVNVIVVAVPTPVTADNLPDLKPLTS